MTHLQHIIACPAVDQVSAGTAIQRVQSVATRERIRASVARQVVVVGASTQAVVASAARQVVVAGITIEHVQGAYRVRDGRTVGCIFIAFGVEGIAIVAPVERVRARAAIQDVYASIATEHIVVRTAVQGVSAQAAAQGVVAGVAVEGVVAVQAAQSVVAAQAVGDVGQVAQHRAGVAVRARGADLEREGAGGEAGGGQVQGRGVVADQVAVKQQFEVVVVYRTATVAVHEEHGLVGCGIKVGPQFQKTGFGRSSAGGQRHALPNGCGKACGGRTAPDQGVRVAATNAVGNAAADEVTLAGVEVGDTVGCKNRG